MHSSTQTEVQPSLFSQADAALVPVPAASTRDVIAKGSKSFYLASLFFGAEARTGCWNLYRWCRAVDDEIDLAPTREVALVRLAELKRQTQELLSTGDLTPASSGLKEICLRYSIPTDLPFDLLRGLEMDVAGFEYRTLEQVELYSYYVAGVVGLMVCHVTGALNPLARPHAVSLGVAMQLTNIARDVREDLALGRIYLPRKWLNEAGLTNESRADLLCPENRARVHAVVTRLLDRADELYEAGYEGLKYLPFRAALAVSIAGSIYSAIGHRVRRRGPEALMTRVYIGTGTKLYLALTGASRVLYRRLNDLVRSQK